MSEKRKPIKFVLTDEDIALQKEKGLLYRKYVTEGISDFLSHVKDKSKVGIMLSGGVDSTTILWALLEQGVRPYCYTFNFPTNKNLSTDALKAKALAEKYNLPLRIVEMPSSPDEIAKLIYKIHEEIFDELGGRLEGRPDFEVLPVFYEMARVARDKDGVTDIFSGIGDSAIHLLGRKLEIQARTGLMTPLYTDYRRLYQMESRQLERLIKMMSGQGSRLLTPLLFPALMDVYRGVPWHVMNTPRLKQITVGAWESEEKLGGVKAVVSPLQNGDAGGRAYYDTLIPRSSFATQYCGRQINTAQTFYNSMKKNANVQLRRDPMESKGEEHINEWYRHIMDGVDLPDHFDSVEQELAHYESVNEVSEDDIFSDVFIEQEDESDQVEYPKGVYSVANEDYYSTVYNAFLGCITDNLEFARRCASAHSKGPKEVFLKWADRAEKHFEKTSQIPH